MADYVVADKTLPRTLDVQISVSNPQTAIRTDLSILCAVCESLGLLPDENRVRFYSDLAAIENDFGTNSEPYRAGTAFFGQSPRAARMAVGEVYLTDQQAELIAGVLSSTDISAIEAVTTGGNLKLTVGGTDYSLAAMDFTLGSTPALIAGIIQAKLTSGAVPATCTVVTDLGGASRITIKPTAAQASIAFPVTTGTGTFVGTLCRMTAATGGIVTDNYGTSDYAGLPAQLVAPIMSAAQITALKAITTGNLKLTIGSTAYSLDGLNFHLVTTVDSIAAVIQAAFVAATIPVPATCSTITIPGETTKQIVITTTQTGATGTITYPITTGTGVFAGTALLMTLAAGANVLQGYVPSDIAGELQNIQNAANAAGEFIYGWCFGETLREPDIQITAAAWALAQTFAFMPLVGNDLSAPDPSYDQDLMSLYADIANKRIMPQYHAVVAEYPDVSILAYMLAVNYRLKDSVVTAKFKQLPGITTVELTETQYLALKAKGYNCYTNMGGGIYTEREGSVPQSAWWADTVINLDNFVDDLGVNVYNVFLRNKKIPYTRAGQMLLVDACRDTGAQYTYNGTFADREVEDTTAKSGYVVVPAVAVNPTPVYQASAADRVARVGPPIGMVVQDSGAIHEIAIAVELVS